MTGQRLFLLLQVSIFFLILIFLPAGFLSAQQLNKDNEKRQAELIRFAGQKKTRWDIEKRKADSIAGLMAYPIAYTEDDSRIIILQRLGRNGKPVYYATDNLSSAATISVDQVWTCTNDYPSLSGEGVEINLWDGGAVRVTHREFQNESGSRIIMRETDLPLSNHSTHIAGTMAASGVDPDARGMAGEASVKGWDLNSDIAEMAGAAADGIILSNHSYGPLCGWDYRETNESWYWYGDPDISETEDYKFGFYDTVSADLDFIAFNAPHYLIVKSAGNDRNDAPASSFVHFVWDGTWQLVNVEREPDGGSDGYDCLNSMAVAKNILTVGAVDDNGSMTAFSAFGPTDDGRIKPDVVANGYNVYSSTAASDHDYGSYNGTSMASASATGSVALLHQLQSIVRPGVPLLSSTLKALLIHTALEAGKSTGPDYEFGWGLMNIKDAADLISRNSENGGKNIYEDVLTEGEVISVPVETGSLPFLKVTLCWTDPAGPVSSVSLNSRVSRLINDLDISIENDLTHQTYLPWVLDVENPSLPPIKGINHVDNVEQVYIASPGEGNFTIKISHSSSLAGGSQDFSLIVSGINSPMDIFPPQSLSYSISPSAVLLDWHPPAHGAPETYKIYRDGQVIALTQDTSYYDETIIPDNIYDYFVTAVYETNNEETESVGTNHIIAFPQTLSSLPFIADFEAEPTGVTIKNNLSGWQWGDSDSLNCYYLDFSDNTTKFIGIDSYSVGEDVHVTDVAATAPLRLGEYENVVLDFDYLLKTGIYGAIDELHVVYKLQEETQWHELEEIESSFEWKSESIELPDEICVNGTMIGFYYDDFYLWGFGAGIDNIVIRGNPVRSVDFSVQDVTAPISSCSLSDDEPVIISIMNSGNQEALPGDVINLKMDLTPGGTVTDVMQLSEILGSGKTLVHQMSEGVDLSEPGEYIFNFTLSSELDHNPANDYLDSSVEVFGFPAPLILNQDTDFCEEDSQVLIEVSPEGGTLTGAGLTGLYFNPPDAGAGDHTISYTYTDTNGCSESVTEIFIVNENPVVSVGPDLVLDLGETAEIEATGNGTSFLWSDGSTTNPLLVITVNWGDGIFDVWVEASDDNQCSSTDSLILTINTATFTDKDCEYSPPFIYPNPFGDGFYLSLPEGEILSRIRVFDNKGNIVINGIPPGFPYFDLSSRAPGSYFLQLVTGKRNVVLKMVKVR